MTEDQLAELVVMTIKQALAPFLQSLAVLEERVSGQGTRLASTEAERAELLAMRERLAVVEARPPIPGPAGRDGAPGANGADGIGFDSVEAAFDGDRTLAFHFRKGELTKTVALPLPMPHYEGIYQAGRDYGLGDIVTDGGSAWICVAPTQSRPNENASAWRLMVKRGRDGRDARGAA